MGAVYESKDYSNSSLSSLEYDLRLQLMGHEEGRIRPVFDATNALTSFEYDYFLKDHLGNVRMVITEERKQHVYPAATLESATYNGGTALSEESKYYNIDPSKVVSKSVATGIETSPNAPIYNNNGNPPYNNNPYSNTSAVSQYVYQMHAGQNKMGLGIVLKVMGGDQVNIFSKSYHKAPFGGYTNSTSPLSLSDIINGFTSNTLITAKGVSTSQVTSTPSFPTNITGLIGNQPAQTTTNLRASINWVIFDEQFRYVSGGFDMVGGTGLVKTHDLNTIPTISIPKNGYIYVYCSNESNYNVFFDNLQVIHTPGQILEETHYYPFGLTMAGISSKAVNSLINNYTFNGGNEFQRGEFADNSGLEIFDAIHRFYDPQIGRFWQIDEFAEANWEWSVYEFAHGNPILFNDPFGLSPGTPETPKETSTAEAPKVLSEVTIIAIPRKHWDRQNVYYRIMDELERRGASIDDLVQPSLREMMHHYDGISKLRAIIAQSTRESDKIILEAASYFIPMGWVTKVRHVKVVAKLFKTKRGAPGKVVDEVAEAGVVAGKEASKDGAKYLYHYTSRESAESILKTGLTVTEKRPFIYTTNAGNLSPLQAQIELALPANRALPNSIIRIDASKMNPTLIRRVSGNLPGYGPGGGTEFLFNQHIPASLIKIIK